MKPKEAGDFKGSSKTFIFKSLPQFLIELSELMTGIPSFLGDPRRKCRVNVLYLLKFEANRGRHKAT